MKIPDKKELKQIVDEIKEAGMDIIEQIEIEYSLRVNIDQVYRNTYHLSQPQLLNKIVSNLGLSQTEATISTMPALTTNTLGKFQGTEHSD